MSGKAKYVWLSAFFSAAAVCAFLGAYGIFNAPPKISVEGTVVESADITGADFEGAAVDDAGGTPEAWEEEPAASEAAAIEDRINENTVIVYEYYYEDDNKTERAEQKAPYALLDLTREQLLTRIEGFSVESFSPSEVVLRKKISRSKNDRYIIGIWEGHVAVFYGGSGINQSGLKEITDTPVSSLSRDERERLLFGVEIEGNEALMKVLEDYGS